MFDFIAIFKQCLLCTTLLLFYGLFKIVFGHVSTQNGPYDSAFQNCSGAQMISIKCKQSCKQVYSYHQNHSMLIDDNHIVKEKTGGQAASIVMTMIDDTFCVLILKLKCNSF